jgi:hypothetical protein
MCMKNYFYTVFELYFVSETQNSLFSPIMTIHSPQFGSRILHSYFRRAKEIKNARNFVRGMTLNLLAKYFP